jgi:prepilin-type N-terminal cleavage/methylation domain-containing protein
VKESCKLGKDGFSLIELTVVMVIGGILLSALSSALLIYVKNAELKKTRTRLAAIDEGIQQYLSLNGRLPCAAPLNAPVDSAEYGREVTALCGDGDKDGTFRATGTDSRMVRIGAVPVRTINLPDDYAIDSWGNRFTYAVTELLASPDLFDRELGAISVVDSNDHSVITPAGSAHYVVVSHGPDRLGGYTVAGVEGASCPSGTLDAHNCEYAARFRRTQITSRASGASHFDDLISVRATTSYGASIPAGAIMAFDLAACPPGWVSYSDATGRTIIGTGEYRESYDPDSRPAWDVTEIYALGDKGGFARWRQSEDEMGLEIFVDGTEPYPSAGGTYPFAYRTGSNVVPHENRPPYLALLYCQKT